MDTGDGTGDGTGTAVAGVVERVFATVHELQDAALRSLGAADLPGPRLEEQVRALLSAPGQLAVGLGLVASSAGQVRLEWWQVDPDAGHLLGLDPDLDPGSVGYYDVTATDWFAVPRSTGRRHVVGPYVDVHGTGRYLLTFTTPVVVAGEFAGVVGADVPVDRFESHLLDLLGPVRQSFVLLDGDRRVVLSTAARWLVGDLVPVGDHLTGPGVGVPGVPWRLHAVAGDGIAARRDDVSRPGSCP